jgi:hypothetical protein
MMPSTTRSIAIAFLATVPAATLAFWTSTAAAGAPPAGRHREAARVAESTVALAERPAVAEAPRYQVTAALTRHSSEPAALFVVGSMLLGLAAAVRRSA